MKLPNPMNWFKRQSNLASKPKPAPDVAEVKAPKAQDAPEIKPPSPENVWKKRAIKGTVGALGVGALGGVTIGSATNAFVNAPVPASPYRLEEDTYHKHATETDELMERISFPHFKGAFRMEKMAQNVFHTAEESMREYEAAFMNPLTPSKAPSQEKRAFMEDAGEEKTTKQLANKNIQSKEASEQLERLEKTASDMAMLKMMSEMTGYSPEELLDLAEASPSEFQALQQEVMASVHS